MEVFMQNKDGAKTVYRESKILTTFENYFEGYRVDDYKGVVFASSFKSLDLISSIYMLLRNRFGGELKHYSDLTDKTYKECIDKLTLKAKSMGANAVLNLKFKQSSTFWRGICKITAFGDAVFASPIGEENSRPVAKIVREGNSEYAICPICNTKYKIRRNQSGKIEILGMDDVDLKDSGTQIYCLSCGTKITIPEE